MVVCNSAAHVQHWQGIIPDSHSTVHDAELGSRNSIALASDFSYHVMAAAPAEVMAEERASRRFRNCADH